jgi:undecaprenyl-diphosphatase
MNMIERLLALDANHSFRLRIAEKPGPARSLAILFAHSGDSWFWLAGLGLVWWLGPDAWQKRAAVMLVSTLVLAVIVMTIKFTVRRQRPAGEWGNIYRRTDPHSFPSGHAARAVLLAVLALGMGPIWFGLLLLLWAPLVVLARVAMGVHYLSDVLAGATIGVVFGFLALSVLPRLAFPV